MEITKKKEKKFEPVVITMVFQTQDEVDNFCEDLEEGLPELVTDANPNIRKLLSMVKEETSVAQANKSKEDRKTYLKK